MKYCDYCYEKEEGDITGKSIRNYKWLETAGYRNRITATTNKVDYLNMFILKGKKDKYAGLMIDSGNGARYVDIKYCPFCGRKLGGKYERRKRIL